MSTPEALRRLMFSALVMTFLGAVTARVTDAPIFTLVVYVGLIGMTCAEIMLCVRALYLALRDRR